MTSVILWTARKLAEEMLEGVYVDTEKAYVFDELTQADAAAHVFAEGYSEGKNTKTALKTALEELYGTSAGAGIYAGMKYAGIDRSNLALGFEADIYDAYCAGEIAFPDNPITQEFLEGRPNYTKLADGTEIDNVIKDIVAEGLQLGAAIGLMYAAALRRGD